MDREQIDLIKRTIARGATDDELALFLQEAKRTGLDPLARQITMVKRWDGREQREVMSIIITIDGARVIAERSSKYAGQDPPQWCGQDGAWCDVWLKTEPPAAARITVYRSDWQRGMTATALYRAYVQTKKDGAPVARWAVDPAGMLAKCAESLALRRTFPQDLSNLYTREEMGVDGDVIDALPIQANSRPVAALEAPTPAVPKAENESIPPPTPKTENPPAKTNGWHRPLDAHAARAICRKKAGWQGDEPNPAAAIPTDRQIQAAAGLLSKAIVTDGMTQDVIDKTRHDVTGYLYALDSMHDLSAGECSAIIDWLKVKDEGSWDLNEYARAEVANIVTQIALDAGQQELEL